MNVFRFNELLGKIKFSQAALTELYNFYFPRIVLHVRRSYPGVPAEDIAQEFFMFLLYSPTPLFVSHPNPWIYAVCDNMCRRYQKNTDKEVLSNNETLSALDLMEGAIDDEDVRKVFEVVKDEVDRKIIYYYYWLGYNFREIAELLGIKPSAVRKRHSRIVKNEEFIALNINKNEEENS